MEAKVQVLHSTVLGYSGRKYGSGKWHGVTNGAMIAEILQTYHPEHVMDPMMGSGTTLEACADLGIPAVGYDIQITGHNLMKMSHRACIEREVAALTDGNGVDFIWWDPPYWNMAQYSDDPDDLCNVPTYEGFLVKLNTLMSWLGSLLSENGIIAFEMADLRTQKATYFINDDALDRAAMRNAKLRKEIRFIHAYEPFIRDVEAYTKMLGKLKVEAADDLVEIKHEYVTILRNDRKGDAVARLLKSSHP